MFIRFILVAALITIAFDLSAGTLQSNLLRVEKDSYLETCGEWTPYAFNIRRFVKPDGRIIDTAFATEKMSEADQENFKPAKVGDLYLYTPVTSTNPNLITYDFVNANYSFADANINAFKNFELNLKDKSQIISKGRLVISEITPLSETWTILYNPAHDTMFEGADAKVYKKIFNWKLDVNNKLPLELHMRVYYIGSGEDPLEDYNCTYSR